MIYPGRHFILFKPQGYISQFVSDVKWKKVLGELYDFPEKTMAIGRLDEDSEGLLFLTTNGMLSETIRGKHIEKEYFVQLDGEVTEEALSKLSNGLEITQGKEKYLTKPAAVSIIPEPDLPARAKKIRDARHGSTSWISIILSEGKNRQIRRMTAAVGFATLRLVRVRIGNTHLGDLQPGEVREVMEFDL